MAKVRCNVCDNEDGGTCLVKKAHINVNKSRKCEAYIFAEAKVKVRKDIEITRVGYRQQQENKRRMKAELKRIKEELKKGPRQGTAQDLGLVQYSPSIVMPGDIGYTIPNKDSKHPLTGDLSRFITTANEKE